MIIVKLATLSILEDFSSLVYVEAVLSSICNEVLLYYIIIIIKQPD